MCLLTQVATYRYSMYVVFISVPVALVRTLATKRLNLTEDGEEEDDDGFLTAGALGGGGAPPEDNQPTKGGWVDSHGRSIGWGVGQAPPDVNDQRWLSSWGWPTRLRVSQGPTLTPPACFPLAGPPPRPMQSIPPALFSLTGPLPPGPCKASPLSAFFPLQAPPRPPQAQAEHRPCMFYLAARPPSQSLPPACFPLTGPPPRPKHSVSFGAKAHHDEETAGLVSRGLDKSASMGPLRAQAYQSSFFGSLAFWRSSTAQVAPTSKRHLAPSLGPQVGAWVWGVGGLGGGGDYKMPTGPPSLGLQVCMMSVRSVLAVCDI